MNIRYCIRTCTARVDMASALCENLKRLVPQGTKIDIVNDYIGRRPIMIFGRYIKQLLQSGDEFDLLVTLEDDAILNDYLHSNIINSPILQEINDLGCLQLSIFSENDLREPTTQYDIDYDCFIRGKRLHYSCGLILTRHMLKGLNVERLQASDSVEFDVELTQACIDLGLLFAIHYPALVGSIPNVKSSLGNRAVPLDELFSRSWNRLDAGANSEYANIRTKLKRFLSIQKLMNV